MLIMSQANCSAVSTLVLNAVGNVFSDTIDREIQDTTSDCKGNVK